MFKNAVLVVACIFLLSACDDKGPEIKEVAAQDLQTKQVVSATSLYLPGGAGVDFGRKATSERVNTNPDGKQIKILSYSFDESASEVDLSLTKVLEAEGYIRTSPIADNVKLHSVYTKNGFPYVSARYLNNKVDAPENKTILVLSWELKP